MEPDLVYFVKEGIENKELMYSLRSVEKNLPGHRVWIVGSCPYNITPDKRLSLMQIGNVKYDRVKNMLRRVCDEPGITDDFILMNDDFFIMESYIDLDTIYTNGTLSSLCDRVEKRYNGETGYSKNLRHLEATLRSMDEGTANFELHVPMKINKDKMRGLIANFPNEHGMRSLYGNLYADADNIADMPDVKIHSIRQEPTGEERFLSTSDISFAIGEVGKYIKKAFPKKSRFESSL